MGTCTALIGVLPVYGAPCGVAVYVIGVSLITFITVSIASERITKKQVQKQVQGNLTEENLLNEVSGGDK